MVEYLREVKITVEVDTNKDTYRETFDNMEDANVWFKNRLEGIG